MAIAKVQDATSTATFTSITTTLGVGAAAGSLLVAYCGVAEGTTPTFDAISGWTDAFSPVRGKFVWKAAVGGETSITFTIQGATSRVLRARLLELSGADVTTPIEGFGSATFASGLTTLLTDTSGQGSNGGYSFAGVFFNTSTTSPYAFDNGFTVNSSGQRQLNGSKSLTADGDVTTNASWTTAAGGSWMFADIKPAAASSGFSGWGVPL